MGQTSPWVPWRALLPVASSPAMKAASGLEHYRRDKRVSLRTAAEWSARTGCRQWEGTDSIVTTSVTTGSDPDWANSCTSNRRGAVFTVTLPPFAADRPRESSAETARGVAPVDPQGAGREQHGVAGKPSDAHNQVFARHAHGAPPELRGVVRGQIHGGVLDEPGQLGQRHQEP